jgi:hypothetical protein
MHVKQIQKKNWISWIKQGSIALVLIVAALTLAKTGLIAHAQPFIPLEGEGFDAFPRPEGETGLEIAKSLVGRLVDNVRFIVGAVAILMIIVSSIRIIIGEGEKDVFDKQRDNVLYSLVGLAVVGLSGEFSRILSLDNGGFLRDPQATLKSVRIFNNTVEIILVFIKWLLGGLATLFLVRAGLNLVIKGGNEEALELNKKIIGWSFFGLVFVLIATPFVNDVFFKIDDTRFPGVESVTPFIESNRLIKELVGATNLTLTIAGPFAILSLIAGGVLYVFANGEDEKIERAKKIMLWSIIGLIIMYGAFGIVSTFVSRQFEGI